MELAVAIEVLCVLKALLKPDVLSLLLSVLVTPFALTVTEQETTEPAGTLDTSHDAELDAAVIDREVCVMPPTIRWNKKLIGVKGVIELG